VSGFDMYCRSQTIRARSHAIFFDTPAPFTTAPTIFDLPTFTTPTFVQLSTFDGAEFALDSSDAWANQLGNYLYMFEHQPRNASRRSPSTHTRLVARVEGNPADPPATFLAAVVQFNGLAWPLTSQQTIYFSFQLLRADARLSEPRIVGPNTVP
jgi:hypothetical protein